MHGALQAVQHLLRRDERTNNSQLEAARIVKAAKTTPAAETSVSMATEPPAPMTLRTSTYNCTMKYSTNQHALPYSEYSGTTSDVLQIDVKHVMRLVSHLARGNVQREQELICGLLEHHKFQQFVKVPDEYAILAAGVAGKLKELYALRYNYIGRIGYKAVLEAISHAICRKDAMAQDFRLTRLANVVGVSLSTLRRARHRVETTEAFELLDPSRNMRKDAVQGDRLTNILLPWEVCTRAEPSMDLVVRMRIGPGQYEPHAVHWQERSTEDIYQKMCEMFGSLCSLVVFYRLRPKWVKKPKKETSLCPYCYMFKLYLQAYNQMIEAVRDKSNKCICDFCTFHKAEAADNKPIPRRYHQLAALMFCPKPVAPSESGFHEKITYLNVFIHNKTSYRIFLGVSLGISSYNG